MKGGLRRAAPWLAGLLLVHAAAAVMRRDDPPYRLDSEEIWARVTGNLLRFGGPGPPLGFFWNRRWVQGGSPHSAMAGGIYRIHADMLCIEVERRCYAVWSDDTATEFPADQTPDPATPRLPFHVLERAGLRALGPTY